MLHIFYGSNTKKKYQAVKDVNPYDYSIVSFYIKEDTVTLNHEEIYSSDKINFNINVGDTIEVNGIPTRIKKIVPSVTDNKIKYYTDIIVNENKNETEFMIAQSDLINIKRVEDTFWKRFVRQF